MNFSEFAQKFSRVLLEGENTVVFTRTLFEAIVQEEFHYLLKMKDDIFKSYYNGRANINALARKINVHTDRCSFEDYIEDAGEVAVKKLCDVFSDAVPDINEKNAGEKLAELFDQIITEAAAMPKKQKGDMKKKASVMNATLVTAKEGGEIMQKNDNDVENKDNNEEKKYWRDEDGDLIIAKNYIKSVQGSTLNFS